MTLTRRDVLRDAFLAGAGLAILGCRTSSSSMPAQRSGWTYVPELLARIELPRIPKRDFPVTSTIEAAIAEAHGAGGGRVVVPAGEHLTGPLRLQSRIELHLEKGAVVKFAQEPERYPLVLTRWEGVELMNYSPLIYAFECEDVAITGEGTLDGQADGQHWWNWKGWTSDRPPEKSDPNAPQIASRNRLFQMGQDGVPVADRVFGPGHFLRPSFIEPYRCKRVLVEGLTIRNAPFWVTHPTLCTSVTVRRINVISHGPNNDGCDPESCKGVLIEDCLFDTGDDCIALKSGRNNDGRRVNVPVEDVVIRNCRMQMGHGGITIGSEISGGARNVFAEHCRLDSPELERGLRLKTNTVRGGIIENVYARDIEILNVQLAPIEIDLRYEPPESGPFVPIVRNIQVERMRSAKSRYGLYIRGLENAPVRGVSVRDSAFRGVRDGHVIEGAVDVSLSGLTVEMAEKGEKK